MKTPLIKIALVTGATSGIGKATASIFAKNGYNVIITGRRKERLNELKEKLTRKYGVDIVALSFDIRDHAAVKKAWKSLKGDWNKIDVLVNNAGLAKGLHCIQEGDTDHWDTMIDTNIKGLLYISRLVTPGMVERRSGFVINVCSSAGHEVYPKGNVYAATKFAVDALTKSMRLDLYTHGIRVGQVSPGHVEETEFALVRFDGDSGRASIYNDFVPLRSKDVADAVYYMVSRPRHVNIQDIRMFSTQQASNIFIDRTGRMDA